MIIKGSMKKETYEIINECLKEVYKLNIKNTGIYADINPNNMM